MKILKCFHFGLSWHYTNDECLPIFSWDRKLLWDSIQNIYVYENKKTLTCSCKFINILVLKNSACHMVFNIQWHHLLLLVSWHHLFFYTKSLQGNSIGIDHHEQVKWNKYMSSTMVEECVSLHIQKRLTLSRGQISLSMSLPPCEKMCISTSKGLEFILLLLWQLYIPRI